MSSKITYKNKVALANDETIADENKVTDKDMNEIKQVINENAEELEDKVDKVEGKGLSTNDYTNEEKSKLEELENYNDEKLKQDISDLQKQVEDLKKNELTESLGGTSLDIQDSADSNVRSIGLRGNSEQDGEPTPDNPVEIKSCGDNGSITEKIVNKNLFNKDTTTRNATFTGANVVSTSAGLFVGDYIKVKPNTSYYINKYGPVVLGLDKDKNSLGYIKNTSSAGAITTTDDCEYIRVRAFDTTIDMETAIANAMVHEGSTATDYVPHQEQAINIPTQQPMRGMVDVRDDFVEVDDNKYEQHYIKRIRLTSDMNINTTQYGTNSYDISLADYCKYIANTIVCKSTHFRGVAYEDRATKGNNIIYTNAIGNIFEVRNTQFETIEDFKDFLDNNEVYVDYVLTDPINLPCTDEQITALEALEKARTYKNVTHIHSEDEVAPIVDLEYVVDTKTYIDNQIKEVLSEKTITVSTTSIKPNMLLNNIEETEEGAEQ